MSDVVWRKSSRSNDTGGDCVEVADLVGMAGVRDSKDPDGPKLALAGEVFADFLDAVRRS